MWIWVNDDVVHVAPLVPPVDPVPATLVTIPASTPGVDVVVTLTDGDVDAEAVVDAETLDVRLGEVELDPLLLAVAGRETEPDEEAVNEGELLEEAEPEPVALDEALSDGDTEGDSEEEAVDVATTDCDAVTLCVALADAEYDAVELPDALVEAVEETEAVLLGVEDGEGNGDSDNVADGLAEGEQDAVALTLLLTLAEAVILELTLLLTLALRLTLADGLALGVTEVLAEGSTSPPSTATTAALALPVRPRSSDANKQLPDDWTAPMAGADWAGRDTCRTLPSLRGHAPTSRPSVRNTNTASPSAAL